MNRKRKASSFEGGDCTRKSVPRGINITVFNSLPHQYFPIEFRRIFLPGGRIIFGKLLTTSKFVTEATMDGRTAS